MYLNLYVSSEENERVLAIEKSRTIILSVQRFLHFACMLNRDTQTSGVHIRCAFVLVTQHQTLKSLVACTSPANNLRMPNQSHSSRIQRSQLSIPSSPNNLPCTGLRSRLFMVAEKF